MLYVLLHYGLKSVFTVFHTQTLTQKGIFRTWGSPLNSAHLRPLKRQVEQSPYLIQLLLDRLQKQWVNTADEAPALLRDLSKILVSNHGIDLATTNSKLQLLGWNGVTLDFQSSLQLAMAIKWCHG